MARTKTTGKLDEKAATPFYHVTAVENLKAILKSGLKGSLTPRNRGETLTTPGIFVLVSKQQGLTDAVAARQIWPAEDIERYVVIQISPAGVTGRVGADYVAESTAAWHRVIQQDLIEPQYLTHVKTRVFNFPGKTIWSLLQSAHAKKRWTPQEWEIAERYIAPEYVAHHRIIEAQLDKRKLTAREWKSIRRLVHPSVIDQQEAFEAKLDRTVVKKSTRKKSKQAR